MPKHLLVAFFTAIAALLAQATLAPFYEPGIARYTTPLICLVVAFVYALFMLRKQWTWQRVFWFSFFTPVIFMVFPPTPEFYGPYTTAAQVLAVVEGGACAVIFISLLRSKATKLWFSGRPVAG